MSHSSILFLFPGPKYNLNVEFKERLERLSDDFEGGLVTISNKDYDIEYGSFRVITNNEPKPRTFLAGIRLIKTAARFLSKRKKEGRPIDLIVTYDPLKTGLIGVLLSKLYSTKLAVEVNGDYASIDNYLDIDPESKRLRKLKNSTRMERFVLTNSTGAKLLYSKQLDAFKPQVNVPVERVFPNHVDLTAFKPAQKDKVLLFVGFPFRRKGLDILISAYKEVASDFPDWKLKIIGWFPDKTELFAHIDNHPKIDYHPPVDRDEMPLHIAQSEIFVLPSRSEAMGRVLLESASCGVTRLGAKVGGIPTVIEDGVDGLLFESENVADLSEKLRLLMSDSKLRESLSGAALERVRTKYSTDKYFENVIGFYRDVLDT